MSKRVHSRYDTVCALANSRFSFFKLARLEFAAVKELVDKNTKKCLNSHCLILVDKSGALDHALRRRRTPQALEEHELLGGWRLALHAGAAVTRREVPRTRCLMLLAQVLRLRLKRDHLSRIAALQVSVFVLVYQ